MIRIEYSEGGNIALFVGDQRMALLACNVESTTQKVPDTENPELMHHVIVDQTVTFKVPMSQVELRKVD